jgi:cold shock CspA family protein
MIGIVKFFDPTKNYGFILPHEGGPEVFFHASAFAAPAALKSGQWVEFELFPDFPKPRAMRVALCGPKRVRSEAYATD